MAGGQIRDLCGSRAARGPPDEWREHDQVPPPVRGKIPRSRADSGTLRGKLCQRCRFAGMSALSSLSADHRGLLGALGRTVHDVDGAHGQQKFVLWAELRVVLKDQLDQLVAVD
jgi:hypothetical protein